MAEMWKTEASTDLQAPVRTSKKRKRVQTYRHQLELQGKGIVQTYRHQLELQGKGIVQTSIHQHFKEVSTDLQLPNRTSRKGKEYRPPDISQNFKERKRVQTFRYQLELQGKEESTDLQISVRTSRKGREYTDLQISVRT